MSKIRPADAADLPDIGRIVDAAYRPYVERIGKPPGPMLDDYASRIREHAIWVVEREGVVGGLLVLLPEAECLLLDNVAVDPT